MPAQKKKWVFDGAIEQYPDDYLDSTHGSSRACIDCHGGDGNAATRALAHAKDWQARPSAETCLPCHEAFREVAATGLHTTLGGYITILEGRGVNFQDPTTLARYEDKCLDCHISNSEQTESRCGHCHVSTPRVAGAGFINGHNFRKTPDMERQCTACHGSRIKDEFFGLNGALTERNGLGVRTALPDVHLAATRDLNEDGYEVGCTFCHSADEMHGMGAPSVGKGDRYNVKSGPQCVDCHAGVVGSNGSHSTAHMDAMSCQVCHAQAYKQCFSCHVDIDVDSGKAYFAVNEADPTLGDRPEGSAPDSLMTFRIGRNPRPDKLNPISKDPYEYALLRHPPIDRDLWLYAKTDPYDNLIPDMTALPTWKYASPHNIQRAGSLHLDPTNCSNCHGADFATYWLTDVIDNAEGWVDPAYEQDEIDANTGVVQTTPIPFDD